MPRPLVAIQVLPLQRVTAQTTAATPPVLCAALSAYGLRRTRTGNRTVWELGDTDGNFDTDSLGDRIAAAITALGGEPQVTVWPRDWAVEEQRRHRAAVSELYRKHGDLALFAAQTADLLPGRWTAEYHPLRWPADQDRIVDGLWDAATANWALTEFRCDRAATLRGPDHTRLLLLEHPVHAHRAVAAAYGPPGSDHEFLGDDHAPHGITTPLHPARTAAAITRRLLPRYQHTEAQLPAPAHALSRPPSVSTAPPTVPRRGR